MKEMIIKNDDGTLNRSTLDTVGTDIRNMQRHVELHRNIITAVTVIKHSGPKML